MAVPARAVAGPMSPLVWREWAAALLAGLPLCWLVAVEVRTSRSVRADASAYVELEERTGRLFDVLTIGALLYAATICALIGIGAVLGNWLSVALLATLPTVALIRRIGIEEAMLLGRLGDDYRRFCRSRARLVPYVW